MVNVGRNALLGGGGGHKIRHNHYTPAKKSCFIAQQKKTQRIFRFRTRYPVQYFDFWNILQILNVEKINAGNFVPCAPRKLFSYCKFQREKLPSLRRKGQSFAGSRREWKERRENWSQRKEGRRSFTVSLPFSPAAREFSVPPSFSQQSETERKKMFK